MFVLYYGRCFLFPCNVAPVSEANFYGDPIVANIIIKYTTIDLLNVTQEALITSKMVDIIDKEGTGQAKHIKAIIDFYYENFYKKEYPDIAGSPIHDLHSKISSLDCTTNEVTRGQSVAGFRKR